MYKPTLNDVPILKKLWKEVFKDTDSYIDLYFSKKFSTDTTFVYRVDGEITSALYYSDVILYSGEKEYKTAYICGIATTESMRKKGQASVLIKECINKLNENGYDAAFLIPAELSLFDFYKRFGFEVFSTLNFSEYIPEEKNKGKVLPQTDIQQYYEKIRCLKPRRTAEDFNVIDECYNPPICFNDGYIYASCENGILNVYEHSYENEQTLKERLNALPFYDIKKIKVKTPSMFGYGETKPFSAYINFKNISFDKDIYINLLLN